MPSSRFKFFLIFICLLSLTCFLYLGASYFLYAQEGKKEQPAVTNVAEPAPAQKVESAAPSKETAPNTQELPEGATADFTENLPPSEEIVTAKKKTVGEPIIVNGDQVEYSADEKKVTATGKVEIDYKGSKLSCDKITLNTLTKEGEAEGNIRLDDKNGLITGSKIEYNFQNKTGTILDADFIANPYFGKARRLEKISDSEFIAMHSYISTCSFDKPHYRMNTSKVDFIRGDKLKAEDASFFIDKIPLLYLPSFSRSFKDPIMHLQMMPGSRSEWGQYVLNTWRNNLAENLSSRLFLDYRRKLGLAEGFGLNYDSPDYGKADFKFYYTNENPEDHPSGSPDSFERYLVRWRQKWDIDERTNLISEFYKIKDEKRKFDPNGSSFDPAPDFLKDYFYQEYEKSEQPLSYALFHHAFPNSSFDFLAQVRTNHWFDQLTKLPEARYTVPSLKIGSMPFYIESDTDTANFNKKATTAPVTINARPSACAKLPHCVLGCG